jgi:hypothetical protein
VLSGTDLCDGLITRPEESYPDSVIESDHVQQYPSTHTVNREKQLRIKRGKKERKKTVIPQISKAVPLTAA